MKELKSDDLRQKSVPELEVILEQERASLYKARRDLVFRQMTDTASLMGRRHNIARILTIIGEKKRGGNS
jgi:ribosomal protein L29